jgi:SAM-dependent methyltransferase
MKQNNITFLSSQSETSMGDAWFEYATTNHFWIKQRFCILQKLAGDLIKNSDHIAEIGCGNGVLQRQIEDTFDKDVDGYDLNSVALSRSHARKSKTYCYNIYDQISSLKETYDLIFLFDVIEHIDNENEFIEKVLFHLRPGGHLVINVPALNYLYSGYDTAAGHIRRYSISSLDNMARDSNLSPLSTVYWGLAMIPLLLARKFLYPKGEYNDSKLLKNGFAMQNKMLNYLLYFITKIDMIKINPLGTSVMGIYQKNN